MLFAAQGFGEECQNFLPFCSSTGANLNHSSSTKHQSAYPREEIKHGMLTQKVAEPGWHHWKSDRTVPEGSCPKRVFSGSEAGTLEELHQRCC